jgi:hypothetical protein
MTRQTKTPAQRAQEQLAVADRHVGRLTDKRANLRTELAAVEAEHDAAVVRRDYLATHPDLPHQQTEQHTTTSTGDPA